MEMCSISALLSGNLVPFEVWYGRVLAIIGELWYRMLHVSCELREVQYIIFLIAAAPRIPSNSAFVNAPCPQAEFSTENSRPMEAIKITTPVSHPAKARASSSGFQTLEPSRRLFSRVAAPAWQASAIRITTPGRALSVSWNSVHLIPVWRSFSKSASCPRK